MKDTPTIQKTKSKFDDELARCSPSDFDGHSAFPSLTPEQRLDALGEMIAFIVEFKGKARQQTEGKSPAPAPKKQDF